MLCWVTAALAAPAASSSVLDAYRASQARCPQGEDGLLISLHKTTQPHLFRAGIVALSQAEHDVFHKDYVHLNAIAMKSIHSSTLDAVSRHEHTRHIEASCIIQHQLPQNVDPRGQAIIFDGRYRNASPQSSAMCEHTISVARPLASSSAATITINSPPAGSRDCSGSASDHATTHRAVVTMLRAHVGTIRFTTGKANVTGTFEVNANGRIQDHVRFDDGTQWTKVPGPTYDPDSSIGPMDDGNVRTRNPAALVRWNWGLDRIDGAGTALNNTYVHGNATGAGTTLYNLDTGVMISHDDLAGRAVGGWSAGCPTGTEAECLTAWAYQGVIDEGVMSRPGACSTHGTHTSSTAAGTLYGVASAAQIVAVQVLSCTGSASDRMLLDGMHWVLEHALVQSPRRPSVISMSLGGQTRSKSIDEMVRTLLDFGILVVAAAGNDSFDACTGSPAAAAEALTIGAVGLTEPILVDGNLVDGPEPPTFDAKADFSDDGSCVNLFAPGVEILAAVPSAHSRHYTSIMSGTSMAAPMAAGVALTVRGLYPEFSPDDVTRAMYCMAVPGIITGLSSHTTNYMIQGGSQLLESANMELMSTQRSNILASNTAVPRDATQCFRPGVMTALPVDATDPAASHHASHASHTLQP